MHSSFAPAGNAASVAILKAGGFVFTPDIAGVREAAFVLSRLTKSQLETLELSARKYAIDNFQISKKEALFKAVINKI